MTEPCWQSLVAAEPEWWCETDGYCISLTFDHRRDLWHVAAADLEAIGARHLEAWFDGLPTDEASARARATSLVAAWRS